MLTSFLFIVTFWHELSYWVKISLTRMHSSRMRTARSLTVSRSIFWGVHHTHAPHHACPLPCTPPATHAPHHKHPPAMHAHCHACPPTMHVPYATHTPPPHMLPCHTCPLPCTPPAMHKPLPCMLPCHACPCHVHPSHAFPPPRIPPCHTFLPPPPPCMLSHGQTDTCKNITFANFICRR